MAAHSVRRSSVWGLPDTDERASKFALDVNYAVWMAELAIHDSVFAHAHGTEWRSKYRPYIRGAGTDVQF